MDALKHSNFSESQDRDFIHLILSSGLAITTLEDFFPVIEVSRKEEVAEEDQEKKWSAGRATQQT